MFRWRSDKAFTLIELLVVVAIIALLIAILLPALARARDQAKKSTCLAHLRDIGTAAHEYATEDETNRLMPMSPIMVRAHAQNYWYRRCAMWFSWGGRGAPKPLLTSSGGIQINEMNPQKPYYGTRQRPLTVYMYPDIEAGRLVGGVFMTPETPVFECPGDSGYPELDQLIVDDAPAENVGNRMYDTVGNSYRGSLACYLNVGGATAFSVGVWGQRLDKLQNTSMLLWGGDPVWYNLIGTDSVSGGWPEVKKYGWHNEFMVENEVFADGHAAAVRAVAHDDPAWMPSDQDLAAWGVDPDVATVLSRGPGWQIDSYPTPGVAISGWTVNTPNAHLWPWRGHDVCPKPPR